MCVDRSSLKHNFLKQIILRFDYDGIVSNELENYIVSLKHNLFSYGYDKFDRRTMNQFDLNLKTELGIPDENSISLNNFNSSYVYCFSASEDGNKGSIEIGESFFTFTVDVNDIYKGFDEYVTIITEVVDGLKNVTQYFKPLRIGLRKIAVCYIKDLNFLASYFKNGTFNVTDTLAQFYNSKCLASNMVTVLEVDGYSVNYVRNLQEGTMKADSGDEETVYQVVLDIDVYREDYRELNNLLETVDSVKETLGKQNQIEFDLFINSLTEYFVGVLKQETLSCNELMGVK